MIQGESVMMSGENNHYMPLPTQVDIRRYDDYRRFLIDRFAELQATDPSFSQRRLARMAGFANPGFFNEVIKGRRRLTSAATRKMSVGMMLSPGDADYLAMMVEHNDSRDPQTRQAMSMRLLDHRNRQADREPVAEAREPYPPVRVHQLDRGTIGLDLRCDQEGHFSSAVFSVSDGTYRRILDRMVDFRGQVLDLVEGDGQLAMRDVQFNLQMLPGSSVPKTEK